MARSLSGLVGVWFGLGAGITASARLLPVHPATLGLLCAWFYHIDGDALPCADPPRVRARASARGVCCAFLAWRPAFVRVRASPCAQALECLAAHGLPAATAALAAWRARAHADSARTAD